DEPCWMPEIGLGIGRCILPSDPFEREVLSWFDERGDRYLSAEEQERYRAEQERQRAEQEQQQRERLEAFLRSQGFDPDHLPES
ncbi:MAG: Uma2 family endonuclease, partial [Thermosynechococcaceae cyanobacterium]